MKIVLAVDGSTYTTRMLAYVAARPELVGSDNEYIAVTVTPPIPSHVASYPTEASLRRYYDEAGEKVLAPIREFARMHGWPLKEHHVVGNPGEKLSEVINQEKPDLVVMGSHGHGAFLGAVLGSVSARVLAQTTAPVLIIR